MPTVFFITHPDVAIDPAVAVPDWPLNGCGQERMGDHGLALGTAGFALEGDGFEPLVPPRKNSPRAPVAGS